MKKIIYISLSICIMMVAIIGFLIFQGYIWLNNPSQTEFPVRGIDVSSYQKDIDWNELKSDKFDFVFIKATEGMDFKDKMFELNWEKSKSIGISRGAYHFFTFRSSGKDQAKNFIGSVPKEDNCLPPVVDIEFSGNSKVIPSKEKFNSELKDFLHIIENYYKKKPILYVTYDSYYRFSLDEYKENRIWIRDIVKYPKIKGNTEWDFWQYNSRGHIKGIDAFVDLNVYNGSKKEFMELLIEQT